MYIPPHFLVPGKETLLRLLPEASFATLISTDGNNLPFATHLPFSYDPDRGEYGTLRGHLARANPHGKLLEDREALVIFQGPHVYISPSFYATDINVPTWNYVAVHAYGVPEIVSEPADVLEILETLTSENEASLPQPWTPSKLDQKRLHGLMRGIIAFDIPVSRLEGKAKLGQNKSVEDQESVNRQVGDLLS